MFYANSLKDICHIDRIVIPWKGEPFPLVSLLDIMEQFHIEDFCSFMSELEGLFSVGFFYPSRPQLTSDELKQIAKLVDKAYNWCELMELNGAIAFVKHIQEKLSIFYIEGPTSGEYGELIRALKWIIEDELRKRLFMFIPTEQAQWYEKKDSFGLEVSKAFPSAIKDIEEAGNCYAAGRYTACVFHLMRVLEHGLRVLATDVCLDFDKQTWHTIINEITSVIKKAQQLKQGRGHRKAKRLKFLSDAALQFHYFKDAWRNDVSHLRYTCENREEALVILNGVKSFMNNLSKELSE